MVINGYPHRRWLSAFLVMTARARKSTLTDSRTGSPLGVPPMNERFSCVL